MDSRELSVELKPARPSYLILRGNYGEKIDHAFRMSRQGVRWRFQRVMDMYISAFETILTIERGFGSELRDMAVRVSRERHEARRQRAAEFQSANQLNEAADPEGRR